MKTLNTLLFAFVLVSCNNSTQKKIDYGSNSQAGKYIDINDIKIYYETYGEGEPLMFKSLPHAQLLIVPDATHRVLS